VYLIFLKGQYLTPNWIMLETKMCMNEVQTSDVLCPMSLEENFQVEIWGCIFVTCAKNFDFGLATIYDLNDVVVMYADC
jgi:hypothetical protein